MTRYRGECGPTVTTVASSAAPGYAALNSCVYGVNGWEKVVASCGWLYIWSRRCAVLAAQAHTCLSGLIDAYRDDIGKWICMVDMEVFGSKCAMAEIAFNGAGVMLCMNEACTTRRLGLWAGAQHGHQLAKMRMSMSTHEEFRAFCWAADSYFVGVLQQQVCVALEGAIGD